MLNMLPSMLVQQKYEEYFKTSSKHRKAKQANSLHWRPSPVVLDMAGPAGNYCSFFA